MVQLKNQRNRRKKQGFVFRNRRNDRQSLQLLSFQSTLLIFSGSVIIIFLNTLESRREMISNLSTELSSIIISLTNLTRSFFEISKVVLVVMLIFLGILLISAGLIRAIRLFTLIRKSHSSRIRTKHYLHDSRK